MRECKNCTHYRVMYHSIDDDDVGSGTCHRYPPLPTVVVLGPTTERPDDSLGYTVWPEVLGDARCGEFTEK